MNPGWASIAQLHEQMQVRTLATDVGAIEQDVERADGRASEGAVAEDAVRDRPVRHARRQADRVRRSAIGERPGRPAGRTDVDGAALLHARPAARCMGRRVRPGQSARRSRPRPHGLAAPGRAALAARRDRRLESREHEHQGRRDVDARLDQRHDRRRAREEGRRDDRVRAAAAIEHRLRAAAGDAARVPAGQPLAARGFQADRRALRRRRARPRQAEVGVPERRAAKARRTASTRPSRPAMRT